MSRRSSNLHKKVVHVNCCAHCKNVGKTRLEYESHNVLNEKGFVSCPVILSNRCSKCGIVGHLPSKCSVSNTIRGFRVSETKQQTSPIAVVDTTGGLFSVLADDEDVKFYTPDRKLKRESTPPLIYRKKAPAPLNMSIINNGECPRAISLGLNPIRFNWDEDISANVTVRAKPFRKCWADMSDDDEDDVNMPTPWLWNKGLL